MNRPSHPAWLTPAVLRRVRWAATGAWFAAFLIQLRYSGVPFDREGLLVWIASLLAAFTIGRRSMWTVIVDWLPFALVLIVYDYLRGLSDSLGMPTWWHPPVDVDKFLFGGTVPTVWLQERLKHPSVQWYDVAVCLCYISFFFLPYVTAGALWLRGRGDFYRWSGQFVGLSFVSFGLFALIPTAPPWAAARCTAAQVANHPSGPSCMYSSPQHTPGGGLLGPVTPHVAGAQPWIEQLATRGFFKLHLTVASYLFNEGRASVDEVAAVPSLHVGGTVLFALFMWNRVRAWARPLLVAYPLFMTFSLVYSGEHYVCDCLAGAMAAIGVHLAANRIERRRKPSRSTATLNAPADPPMEAACQPTATTPSST